MDLLIRHFEKLVLVLCILFLMCSLFLVNSKVASYSARSKNMRQDSVRKVSGGEVLPELDMSVFNGVSSINDARNLINVTPTKFGSRSGLYMPAAYILCKNPECNNLMNFNDDVCPFCKSENDPKGKEVTMKDDIDGDGIPDLIEKKYSDFLNFLNPDDGYQDQDQDGFLNHEEYKNKTDMDDAASHPDLGLLLRRIKVFKRNIPFVFSSLRTVGSDNKNDWKIVLKAGAATLTKQLNDQVGKFKLLAVTDDGSEITVLSEDNVQYRMPLGKRVFEDQYSARLLFLTSRKKSDLRIMIRRFCYLKRNGETFELKKQIGDRQVSEFYKLTISGVEQVKIGKLDASKEKVAVEYTVDKFDMKKDFEKSERNERSERSVLEDGRSSGSRRRRQFR